MENISENKIVYLVFIPVLIAIVSNVIWEFFIRKYIPVGSKLFFRVFSFGFKKVVDKTYIEVARRNFHRNISFINFMFFMFFMASAILLGMTSHQAFYGSEARQEIKKLKNEMTIGKDKNYLESMDQPEVEDQLKILADELKKLEEEVEAAKRKIEYANFFGALIFSMSIIYSYIRNSYICNAILHFDQCLARIGFVITDDHNKEFRFLFSKIESREDYAKLLNSMEVIAFKNNIQLPYFSII